MSNLTRSGIKLVNIFVTIIENVLKVSWIVTEFISIYLIQTVYYDYLVSINS